MLTGTEFLVWWGVENAVGFLFKKVFIKLAAEALQDGFKDYLKDFFKGCFKEIIDINQLRALKIAYGQANKIFVQLFQNQLEKFITDDQQIQSYENALDKFIHDQTVREVLGQPLQQALGLISQDETLPIDRTLLQIWERLNLQALPQDFKWQEITRQYYNQIRRLARQNDDLREILNSQTQSEIRDIIKQNAPVAPDFIFSRYQQNLIDGYSRLKLDNLDTSGYGYRLELWNIFVPQNLRENSSATQKIYSITDVFNPQNNYKYVVILGAPGSGKSTLTQYKSVEWAKISNNSQPIQELPLLVELRNFVENKDKKICSNFLEYFHKASGIVGGNLNQQELDDYLLKNPTLVMFDGLDEVLNPQERENVVIEIINFKNTYSLARILVTSRVVGYEQQGYRFRHANFREFVLQDLNEEQIKAFVNQWHKLAFDDKNEAEVKRNRLQNSINNSRAFRELAGNPLLLTMMAILNRHEELPRDRYTLYEHASQVLLQRWDDEKNLSPSTNLDPEVYNYIEYKDKRQMLRLVAHRMQESNSNLANQISQEDLEETLTEYLKKIFPQKAVSAARGLRQILTSRSFVLCFLGGESYGFVHRTFLEYFCALYFVEEFEKKRKIDIEYIKKEIFDKRWHDESWHEVLALIVAQIYEDFAADIIDNLIQKHGEQESFCNLFLAQQCISNMRNYRQLQCTTNKLINKLQQLAVSQKGVNDDLYEKAVSAITELESLA